jgi:hypothetical protein
MITINAHGQSMWFHMRLPSDIRAKMILLWRIGLFVNLMHGHLHASKERG